MPWCPTCMEEYIEGVAKCDECGSELVKDKPDIEIPTQDAPHDKFLFYDSGPLVDEVLLIAASDEVEFAFFYNVLDDAKILCRVTKVNSNILTGVYSTGNFYSKNIYVSNADYDRAIEACKSSVVHLPLDIPPEVEIGEDETGEYEQYEEYDPSDSIRLFIFKYFKLLMAIGFILFFIIIAFFFS